MSGSSTPEALLTPEDIVTFEKMLSDAGEAGAGIAAALGNADLANVPGREYEHMAQVISGMAAAFTRDAKSPVNHRVLSIAALLLRLPPRVAAMQLPATVLPMYPREIQKIKAHMLRDPERAYPTDADDAFIKDARFVTGRSIPCGAQSVEIDDQVRFRSLVKHLLFTRDPVPLGRLGALAFGATWFGIHTDSRDLSEFNEPGWIACYRRIGELLKQRPSVAGVVGTSWFFDPQVMQVSPRLGYLQTLPLQHGAIAIRNGPAAVHTERATATSESRRKLYEQGKYLPVCYTIAWPRAALLEWCAGANAHA